MKSSLLNKLGQFFSNRMLPITMLLSLSLCMVTVAVANPQVAVYINGQYLGTVAHYEEVENEILNIEQKISSVIGSEYNLDVQPEYRLVYTNSDLTTVSMSTVNNVLSGYVDEIAPIAVLYVDDQPLFALETLEQANAMLEKVLVLSVGEELADYASFVENIYIKEEYSSVAYLVTEDYAIEYLTATKTGEAIHKVQANQTLSSIALMYDMSTSEVEALNPDIEPTKMQIGQELVIEKAKPEFSVEITQEETYDVQIAYQTQTTYDDTMTTNQKKTVTAGVYGINEVVANVTYIDGVEVEREIISETTMSEPSDAVVAIGTKPTVVTGTYKMPTYGATLSSPYGYRSSGFHTGIDLAASYGTSIYASDGGTVIYSGWNGGYGYCIIIDHGNNMTTLYGHCSSLLVSVGTKVNQGDKIALMGSTGNSTGNHLHFEIRVNDQHVNPYNYLY